jgi:hypothetical protein
MCPVKGIRFLCFHIRIYFSSSAYKTSRPKKRLQILRAVPSSGAARMKPKLLWRNKEGPTFDRAVALFHSTTPPTCNKFIHYKSRTLT